MHAYIQYLSIHPFIFCSSYSAQGHKEPGAHSRLIAHAHSQTTDSLMMPISTQHMSLDWGKKPD